MADKVKKKQAIALEYDPNDSAPKVIASGQGVIAEKIMQQYSLTKEEAAKYLN